MLGVVRVGVGAEDKDAAVRGEGGGMSGLLNGRFFGSEFCNVCTGWMSCSGSDA